MSGASWVLLEYSFPIEGAIEDWWSSPSFDPTNVAFNAHVILFHAPAGQKDYYLDPRTINPYEDRLILCYRVHKAKHKIELLGTIQARQHMETDGYFIEAALERTRRAKIPESLSPSNSRLEFTPPLFYFPTCNMNRITEFISDEKDIERCVQKRVDWLLSPSDTEYVCSEKEEVVSMIMMHLVHQAMEFITEGTKFGVVSVPKARIKFYKSSMEAEKRRFMSKFAKFRTEASIIDLFANNNDLLSGTQFVRGSELDPQDYQCFYRRFGEDPSIEPPTLFFKVPLEEVPYQLAKDLPLHKGMQLHLSYLDVAFWVWNVYEIQFQRYGTRMKRDSPLRPWVINMAKQILTYKPKEQKVKRNHVHIKGGPVDPKAGFTMATQELIDCMPPCMKTVVTTHFPRNTERMTLIPALREAGVSLETAQNLFDNLNNRYPSTGGAVDLKVRFNVTALWNRTQGATFCKRIIQRTEQKAVDQLHCPVYKEETKDANTVPNCRACKRGAGIPDMEDMYAPHLFLRYKLTERMEKEPVQKKKKEHKKMIVVESSSDDDDDEIFF